MKTVLEVLKLYWLTLANAFRFSRDFDNLKAYVMFIGYPRSGHSLVGALLDAHPNIILANEANALKFLKMGLSKNLIFARLLAQSQVFFQTGSRQTGYSDQIPNSWQGKFSTLEIIGDKKGGKSTRLLKNDLGVIRLLEKKLGVPVKLIHVIRNPFDNITTRAKEGNLKNIPVEPERLESLIDIHFRDVQTIQDIKDLHQFDMLDIKGEDLINNPDEKLMELCDFLKVSCKDDYRENCNSIIYSSPNKSRSKIEWPNHLKSKVQQQIDHYLFLKGYSFDS